MEWASKRHPDRTFGVYIGLTTRPHHVRCGIRNQRTPKNPAFVVFFRRFDQKVYHTVVSNLYAERRKELTQRSKNFQKCRKLAARAAIEPGLKMLNLLPQTLDTVFVEGLCCTHGVLLP